MARALVIILLALGVAGFGLCSVSAALYAMLVRSDAVFVGMSLGTLVLTVLCVLGFRAMARKPPAKAPPPPIP